MKLFLVVALVISFCLVGCHAKYQPCRSPKCPATSVECQEGESPKPKCECGRPGCPTKCPCCCPCQGKCPPK